MIYVFRFSFSSTSEKGAAPEVGEQSVGRASSSLAVLSLAAPVLLFAQSPDSVESDLRYGREYMDAGNASSAAIYFRQAVAKAPDHAEANLLLASALAQSGAAAEAKVHYSKAISLDPSLASHPEALSARPAGAQVTAMDRFEQAPRTGLDVGMAAEDAGSLYLVGQPVDVQPAPGAAWTAGVVIAIVPQDDGASAPEYQVRHKQQQFEWTTRVPSERLRAAAPNEFSAKVAAAPYSIGQIVSVKDGADWKTGTVIGIEGGGSDPDRIRYQVRFAFHRGLMSTGGFDANYLRPGATSSSGSVGNASNAQPSTCDDMLGACLATNTSAAKNACFVRANQCRAALGN